MTTDNHYLPGGPLIDLELSSEVNTGSREIPDLTRGQSQFKWRFSTTVPTFLKIPNLSGSQVSLICCIDNKQNFGVLAMLKISLFFYQTRREATDPSSLNCMLSVFHRESVELLRGVAGNCKTLDRNLIATCERIPRRFTPG